MVTGLGNEEETRDAARSMLSQGAAVVSQGQEQVEKLRSLQKVGRGSP